MSEVYISVDIETDGPIPGPNSMLSFGAAAYLEGQRIGVFEANLELLDGAAPHPDTAKFWREHPDAYAATRHSLKPPHVAMQDFVTWVSTCPGKPVFVAYPAGFDFLFMYWYMIRFVGHSPFSFSALDLKTFAMAKLGCNYRDAVKRNMPKHWFSTRRHTHVALDDAIEQGDLFMAMLKED